MYARAHVARLLLHPHHLFEPRVGRRQLQDLVLWERVEQLYAADRDPGVGRARGVTDEVVIDLAAAEQQPRHRPGVDARLGEHRQEPALREILEPARRLRQPQQQLRRHDHQRPLLRDPRLAAQ
jgi:hypothetical protein